MNHHRGMLETNFQKIYNREGNMESSENNNQLISFQNNSKTNINYIPKMMDIKLVNANEEISNLEHEDYFNQVYEQLVVDRECILYFQLKQSVEANTQKLLKEYKKKIEAILVRKNILEVKQQINEFDRKIKVIFV